MRARLGVLGRKAASSISLLPSVSVLLKELPNSKSLSDSSSRPISSSIARRRLLTPRGGATDRFTTFLRGRTSPLASDFRDRRRIFRGGRAV